MHIIIWSSANHTVQTYICLRRSCFCLLGICYTDSSSSNFYTHNGNQALVEVVPILRFFICVIWRSVFYANLKICFLSFAGRETMKIKPLSYYSALLSRDTPIRFSPVGDPNNAAVVLYTSVRARRSIMALTVRLHTRRGIQPPGEISQ